MPATKNRAVLISPLLPLEVRDTLSDYIHLIGEQHYFLSRSFEVEGYFAAMNVLKNDKSKKLWMIRIPVQFVLAVVDMPDKDSDSFGFLS